jgi:hypothetical protein
MASGEIHDAKVESPLWAAAAHLLARAMSGRSAYCKATSWSNWGLVLQRQFVTVRSVTVDAGRPPPNDLKVCGQQKTARWPLASA